MVGLLHIIGNECGWGRREEGRQTPEIAGREIEGGREIEI